MRFVLDPGFIMKTIYLVLMFVTVLRVFFVSGTSHRTPRFQAVKQWGLQRLRTEAEVCGAPPLQ